MRRLLLALLFALLPSWAMGAVTYNAVSSGSAAGAASLTFSHTVTGTNVVLYCGVGFENSTFTMGLTYNGVSMTSIAYINGADGNKTLEVFRLIAPATGAHNVVVTVTGGTEDFAVGCISFSAANQTTPEGTIATDGAPFPFSANITVSANGAGLSFGYLNENGTCDGDAVATQTERFDLCDANSINEVFGSTTTSTGSVAMAWTLTVDNGLYRMIVAIPVEPAAVGSTPIRRRAIIQR